MARIIERSRNGRYSPYERRTRELLANNTPDEWICYWGFRSDATVDPDFIIAIPDKGIIVLEVKGKEFRDAEGRWYRWEANKRKDVDGPYHQAAWKSLHFETWLTKRNPQFLNRVIPLAFLNGLSDGEMNNMPGGALDPQSFLRRNVANNRDLLTDFLFNLVHHPLDTALNVTDHLEAARLENFGAFKNYKFSLKSEATDILDEIVLLDDENEKALGALREQRFVHVYGGPGTGKTIQALNDAQHHLCSDRRVLYMVFTNDLRKLITRDTSLGLDEDQVHTMSSLARMLGQQCGINIRNETEHLRHSDPLLDKWHPLLVQYAGKYLMDDEGHSDAKDESITPERYDVIICDEAQSYRVYYWNALASLLKKNGRMHIFSDKAQRMEYPIKELKYGPNWDKAAWAYIKPCESTPCEVGFPLELNTTPPECERISRREFKHHELKINYRNRTAVSLLLHKINPEIAAADGMPEWDDINITDCTGVSNAPNDEATVVELCLTHANKLAAQIREADLSREKAVILTDISKNDYSPNYLQEGGRPPHKILSDHPKLTADVNNLGLSDNGIFTRTSVRRLQGLEAWGVVLLLVNPQWQSDGSDLSADYKITLVQGISRATRYLTIIAPDKKLREYLMRMIEELKKRP